MEVAMGKRKYLWSVASVIILVTGCVDGYEENGIWYYQ